MNENLNSLLRAEQVLNATVLRGENTLLPLEGFNIRFIMQEKEHCSSTYTPYQHQHTYFEMHMPLQGMQTYQIGEETVTLKPFEIILFTPNTMHAIPYSSGDILKFSASFMLLQSPRAEEFSWVDKELFSRSYLTARADRWYEALFMRIFREADLAQPGWTTMVLNMLSQLIIDIARENLHKEKKTGDVLSLQRKRIESIERFIMNNISATITNRMVAEHMYLSIRQLDRVTMAERGMTLKALIDTMKMREARRLLAETKLGQREISTALGFSEVSAFNRYFRRFEGISPGAFRTRSQSGAKSMSDGGETD